MSPYGCSDPLRAFAPSREINPAASRALRLQLVHAKARRREEKGINLQDSHLLKNPAKLRKLTLNPDIRAPRTIGKQDVTETPKQRSEKAKREAKDSITLGTYHKHFL